MRPWLFALALLLCQPSDAQTDSAYAFFVAGHTYGRAGVDNAGLHPPFVSMFGYLRQQDKLRFGILTGDMVSANPDAQDWDEVDRHLDSLGLPVFFAAGNHDVEDRPLYESRYGRTYYHFRFGNDLFLVLDPNLDRWNISGGQLEYLRQVLATEANSARNIFVFFHQVLWWQPHNQHRYIQPNSLAGRAPTINFWTEVMPLFEALPNPVALFAGDLGAKPGNTAVSYHQYANIRLIGSGMGGGTQDNVIVAHVTPEGTINFDLVCLHSENPHCLGALPDYQRFAAIHKRFRAYPNPTHGVLSVALDAGLPATIRLSDFSGKCLREVHTQQEETAQLDVHGLARGLYVLEVSTAHGTAVSKVMID
ncbi:MAG: T9SS type A sorting domain-containing protein [Bacteroidota bacterium]